MGVVPAILAAGPDSFWPLDEAAGSTFEDDIGAEDGSEVGTLTQGQTSIVPGDYTGKSVLFPHDGSAIDFTNAYDRTGSLPYTAYFWMRPVAADLVNGHFFWSNIDASARGWALQTVSEGPGNIAWRMLRGDNAGFDQVDFNTTVSEFVGTKQVAMRYDGTNLVLNLNGVDVAQGASPKSLVAPTTNTLLRFGAYGGGGSSYDGYAQDLAIFTRALSEAELAAIYRAATSIRQSARLFPKTKLASAA